MFASVILVGDHMRHMGGRVPPSTKSVLFRSFRRNRPCSGERERRERRGDCMMPGTV